MLKFVYSLVTCGVDFNMLWDSLTTFCSFCGSSCCSCAESLPSRTAGALVSIPPVDYGAVLNGASIVISQP